jgi:transposase
VAEYSKEHNIPGARNLKKIGENHHRACVLLMQGKMVEDVAEELGVSPVTVTEWKRCKRFKRYFRKMRREAHDESIAILQAASRNAVKVIVETMNGGGTQDALPEGKVRGRPDLALQAALSALNISDRWIENVDVVEELEEVKRKLKKRT